MLRCSTLLQTAGVFMWFLNFHSKFGKLSFLRENGEKSLFSSGALSFQRYHSLYQLCCHDDGSVDMTAIMDWPLFIPTMTEQMPSADKYCVILLKWTVFGLFCQTCISKFKNKLLWVYSFSIFCCVLSCYCVAFMLFIRKNKRKGIARIYRLDCGPVCYHWISLSRPLKQYKLFEWKCFAWSLRFYLTYITKMLNYPLKTTKTTYPLSFFSSAAYKVLTAHKKTKRAINSISN